MGIYRPVPSPFLEYWSSMAYKRISPITVDEGGIGVKTLTANGPLYGNGTSAIQSISAFNRSGAYLASQGSSLIPVFTNGNTLVLLSSKTAVGGAGTVDFTSLISTTYSTYFLLYTVVSASVGHVDTPVMRFSTNNGTSYVTSGYRSSLNFNVYNSTTITNVTNTDRMAIGASPAAVSVGVNGHLWMHNLKTSKNAYMYGQAFDFDGASFQRHMTFSSSTTSTQVDAFRIFWNGGGNIFGTGKFSLYGLLE